MRDVAQELDTTGTGFGGPRAEIALAEFLRRQWAAVSGYEAEEAAAAGRSHARARELAELEAELGALRGLVPHVVRQRREDERAALDRAARDLGRERRRDRVRDHLAAYVRDVQHEVDLAHMRADKAARRAAADDLRAAQLRDQIDELVLTAGVRDARGVYEQAYGWKTTTK